MAKVSVSTTIARPIETVFKYTASPYNMSSFIPNLSKNTDISPAAPGVNETFHWQYNLIGIPIQGEAKYLEFERPYKVKIETSGEGKTTWTYLFKEVNEHSTLVTIDVEYEFSESVLQQIADRIFIDRSNQNTAEQMIKNLKLILENIPPEGEQKK